MEFIQRLELLRLLNQDTADMCLQSPTLVGHEQSHLRVVQQEQFITGRSLESPGTLEDIDELDTVYLRILQEHHYPDGQMDCLLREIESSDLFAPFFLNYDRYQSHLFRRRVLLELQLAHLQSLEGLEAFFRYLNSSCKYVQSQSELEAKKGVILRIDRRLHALGVHRLVKACRTVSPERGIPVLLQQFQLHNHLGTCMTLSTLLSLLFPVLQSLLGFCALDHPPPSLLPIFRQGLSSLQLYFSHPDIALRLGIPLSPSDFFRDLARLDKDSLLSLSDCFELTLLLALRLMECKYLKRQQDNQVDALLAKIAVQEEQGPDLAQMLSRLDGYCIINYKQELARIKKWNHAISGHKLFNLVDLYFMLRREQKTPFLAFLTQLPYETPNMKYPQATHLLLSQEYQGSLTLCLQVLARPAGQPMVSVVSQMAIVITSLFLPQSDTSLQLSLDAVSKQCSLVSLPHRYLCLARVYFLRSLDTSLPHSDRQALRLKAQETLQGTPLLDHRALFLTAYLTSLLGQPSTALPLAQKAVSRCPDHLGSNLLVAWLLSATAQSLEAYRLNECLLQQNASLLPPRLFKCYSLLDSIDQKTALEIDCTRDHSSLRDTLLQTISTFTPERVTRPDQIPLDSALPALSTNRQLLYHHVLLHACHIYYALDDYPQVLSYSQKLLSQPTLYQDFSLEGLSPQTLESLHSRDPHDPRVTSHLISLLVDREQTREALSLALCYESSQESHDSAYWLGVLHKSQGSGALSEKYLKRSYQQLSTSGMAEQSLVPHIGIDFY